MPFIGMSVKTSKESVKYNEIVGKNCRIFKDFLYF